MSILLGVPSISYPRPTGGATFHLPLVPAFSECIQAQQDGTHGGSLPANSSCSNPAPRSSTVTLGTSITLGTRVGYGDIAVCSVLTPSGICSAANIGTAPDVRLRGNSSDIVCKSGAPPAACPDGNRKAIVL